jgi:hypothetical protein
VQTCFLRRFGKGLSSACTPASYQLSFALSPCREDAAGLNFRGFELKIFHSGKHMPVETARQLVKVPNMTRTSSNARPAPKDIAVAIHMRNINNRSHSY